MVACYPMPDEISPLAALAASNRAVSSHTVCRLIGVTYRQLDYAVRTCPELLAMASMAAGSGSRRRWPVSVLPRLMVAAALAEAAVANGSPSGSRWNVSVAAVMASEYPPPSGFAVLRPGDPPTVDYLPRILMRDVPVGPLGTVVRYEIDVAPVLEALAAA